MPKGKISPEWVPENARGIPTLSLSNFLSRIPAGRFSNEFEQLKQRLSRLSGGKAGESDYFETAGGGGIYVQGPQVMFKNVIDNVGIAQNYDFFIDDVAFIYRDASVFFILLRYGYGITWKSYIVFCDKANRMLAAAPPHPGVRDFLVHLMAS
jgi:hypothetical protein